MKKTIIWSVVLLSILVLILRFSSTFAENILGIKQKSGISVLSMPESATVFIDGQEVGKTPFEDNNLEAKEYVIRLEKDGASYQGNIKLIEGTITIVLRDLAKDLSSSAGEVLSLRKGKGVTVISNPSNANITIDDKIVGKTPATIDIDPGEYIILVSHPNYLNRSIKVTIPKDFNLIVSTDLALSEADLTQISAPVITQTPQVVVKNTPTGFLRVRDKASVSGKEIAQVKVGETLILLEEKNGWDRVRLSSGLEGFVSAVYVQKKVF